MKALKSLFTLALVASAFASCQKVEDVSDSNSIKTVNFTAVALETRTAFGTQDGTSYPTLWTENDSKVKVSLNMASAKEADITPSSDGKTASFSVDIEDDENENGSYTFYALSPSSAVIGNSASYNSWTVEIPDSQTPTIGSVDEKAQVLVAESEAYDAFPSSVKLSFMHLTAYGKMSFKNLNLGDATINSISLTASKPWVGRWFYYVEDGNLAVNSGSSTITLTTSATENIWFACVPVDLSNETLKVTVNTSAGSLEKTINFEDKEIKFEAGVINKFAIDMDGIGFEESKVYTLVTDLSDLTDGSKVIIAAPDANYAMSTTQNTNNRAQASVTKKDNTIVDPADNVQIFTLEQGAVDNTVAFNTGSGYIYAASSTANYLRTQDNNDANASFSANIVEGVATLIAQGTNTRNFLRYNASNNPPVFSCYAENSSVQGQVSLYKLEGSGSETPLIVVDNTEYSITVEEPENGTVSASAETAKQGTEITLTVSPAEGYSLDAISVKDAEDNDVPVSNNKFTMPASNVTVTATFKVIPNGYTITWNADNNSQSVSSYVNNWNVTADGLTLAMENWNNNSNKWDYVKAGSKNDAYVSTITSPSIPEAVKSVTLTIDAVTVSSINSLKLEVSSSADFSSATSYSFTIATGDQSVTITSPATDLYYRIVVDCSKGSSNGLITVSKLVFAI